MGDGEAWEGGGRAEREGVWVDWMDGFSWVGVDYRCLVFAKQQITPSFPNNTGMLNRQTHHPSGVPCHSRLLKVHGGTCGF